MREQAITATDLVREFKGGIKAVDGVSLQVAAGEIYAFLGPNGAGKSTTVLMLTTLLPPTSGTAKVAGFDIVTEGRQVRSQIGAALQEVALDPLLTGREHMMMQSAMLGLAKPDRARRISELLERVGLAEAAGRKVGGYSGGMKRKLDLAMGLLNNPPVLFLDEPTTGLDIGSRTTLWTEVERLARQDGVAIFLTTQYLEEADALADRVGIIDRGKIVAEGTPQELKAELGGTVVAVVPAEANALQEAAKALAGVGDVTTVDSKVSVRLPSGDSDPTSVLRALDKAKVKIASLEMHEPSLDDVFLSKTGHGLQEK